MPRYELGTNSVRTRYRLSPKANESEQTRMPAGTYHKLARRTSGPRRAVTYQLQETTADALAAEAARLGVAVSDMADYVLSQGLAALADGRIPTPATAPASVRRIVR